ncbi:MAG TPA: hypothetical protein QF901_08070 [Gammaproteobacteria bacterium]|nr:hypothetical protein [Gammaproteobacteria bacterium]
MGASDILRTEFPELETRSTGDDATAKVAVCAPSAARHNMGRGDANTGDRGEWDLEN